MTIKILIADDHDVVRAGLKAMLEKSDIKIIAEASDGGAAFKLAKKHRPNLVLLDVRMPAGDGLTCLGRLRLDLPEIPVVMFSSYAKPTYIARSVAPGAAGSLLKNSSREKIMNAIRAAAGGDSIWSKEDLRRVTGA